ncbi:MAG: DUF4058 family protein [Anaerolineae bacterium]
MPSPFPGMDPYIEHPDVWSDFHGGLAGEIRATLNATIQPRYVARMIPYVTYEVIEVAQTHGIRPDADVWQPQPPAGPAEGVAMMVTPAPAESLVPLRLYSVEIRTAGDMLLVTAIEILSPVNKRAGHEARVDYLRKRRELLRSQAHFMEIDLLRGGERPPLETPHPPISRRASRSPG